MIKGRKKRFLLINFLVWTFWVLFYMVAFHFQTGESWLVSIIASSASNYTYAFLSIFIWILCKRLPFNGFPFVVLGLIHFILANIFSILWLFITYGSWYLRAGAVIFEQAQFRSSAGWQFLFGIITYLLIAGIFYTIIYYRQFREKELREAELKLLKRDAEFKALKMQVNPHFLFNSLNSINALISKQPKQAREMMGGLSDLLRMTLENRDKMRVPLKEELDLAHVYLGIEKIRFADRLKITEDVDPNLMVCAFPAMILQPLLENSIRHGIAEQRGDGVIAITIQKSEGYVTGVITNTISRYPTGKEDRQSNGTGLDNIQQRLRLLYGDDFTFLAGKKSDTQYQVTLKIPLVLYGKN